MNTDITLTQIQGLLENFSRNVYRAKDMEPGSLVSTTIFPLFKCPNRFFYSIGNNESESFEDFGREIKSVVLKKPIIVEHF